MLANDATPGQRRFLILYLGALAGFLLSKGAAIVPGYGLDDYAAVMVDRPLWYNFAQGRFTQAGVNFVMSMLHISVTAVQWPFIITFIVGGAAAIALGLAWALQGRGSVWPQAAAAALMAAFPYLTEYFWFRESLVTQCPSFLLMALFFASMGWQERHPMGWRGYVVPLLTLVLLAGAQQTAFIVAAFFAMSRMVVQAIDGGVRATLVANRSLMVTFAAAVVIYIILFMVSRQMGGPATDERASLVRAADIPQRLGDIGHLVRRILVHTEPVRSSLSKKVLDLALIAAIVLVARRRRGAALAVVALFGAMFLGSILLVSVSHDWWPVPRAVYGVGFAFGLAIAVAAAFGQGRQRVLACGIALAAFLAAMESSAMLHDQNRLNRWDLATGYQIAHDVLAATGGRRVPVVLSVPRGYTPYSMPVHTQEGDLNKSALEIPWAAHRLLSEATGNHWDTTQQVALPACDGTPAWPAPGAISLMPDGAALVCMGQP